MKKILPLLAGLLLPALVWAQPTTRNELVESFQQREAHKAKSSLKNLPVRNIGPTVQGGRVTDIDVNPQNPHEYWVAYASGGLFKTLNNGISFEPVFDDQETLGMGDIAIAPSNPQVVYVGTGEKNSSRSSYAGYGVYKTTDGGATWKHLGLEHTQHIGRILVHPTNPDIVWVAALGGLYSTNEERGVFKSTDGGATWKKTLFINNATGVVDLIIHPTDPNRLMAATWERSRQAWDFKGSGPGSGIHRSMDGGETWTKVAGGFPTGDFVGRIGLDVCQEQPETVYALLDNLTESKEKREAPKDGSLRPVDFSEMKKDDFLKMDSKKLDAFLKQYRYPEKYSAEKVKDEVRKGKYEPKALAEYFGDANEALFNTRVTGAEVYRSDDFGATWKKTNSYALDGVYFTYGYYFGEIRVAPDNPQTVYALGVPMLKSTDGGVTFLRADTIGNVHVDHQALWINPKNSKHLLLGNDGGLYVSYDEAAQWKHINNTSVGQFYTINVDMEKPYNVYGGLQDNGTLKGSSRSVPNRTKDWEELGGGDGMFVNPDPRNSNIVYVGYQFGNYTRRDLARGTNTRITPRHDIGEPVLRFNWRTPVILSPHHADVLYLGAQRLYRSLDKGDNWEAISPDLTTNRPQGNVPYSTITCVAESPLKFGLIYVGTDDGHVQVTHNGGGSWELITNGLPKGKWVANVHPSAHEEGTVFVTLNGYREDDFRTYVYQSTDYGKTWISLKANLPDVVNNVIIQDPVNADLLYLGTDHGTYFSLSGGKSWTMVNQLINVASYDMIVHPRDHELVVGTHGRSVYVMDVKPLQALKGGALSKAVKAFSPESIRHSERWGQQTYAYSKPFAPSVQLMYHVGRPADQVVIEIYNEKKEKVRELTGSGEAGIQLVPWDVKIGAPAPAKKGKVPAPEPTLTFAPKGTYTFRFVNGKEADEVKWELK
jgi:photosystem II stability/assembly factor-like uncharacterized protein